MLVTTNILLFLAVLAAAIYAYKQVSAIRATTALELLIRIDERLCSPYYKNIRDGMKTKAWDPKSVPPDKKSSVNDLLGIFELIGLAIEKKYVSLEDAEIMFGSILLSIYDDYGYKEYIEEDPFFLRHTRKFAEKVRELRKKRSKSP